MSNEQRKAVRAEEEVVVDSRPGNRDERLRCVHVSTCPRQVPGNPLAFVMKTGPEEVGVRNQFSVVEE